MKTLKLFNAIIARELKANLLSKAEIKPFISDEGFIIDPKAIWAKDDIIAYYNEQSLEGNALNASFHKSWSVIKNSSKSILTLHQIQHYISTYGSNFEDEIYIPSEVLDVPNVKLRYKVINALSVQEIQAKCFDLLNSGIALKEETIDDIFSIFKETDYTFTGKENINNKEAIIRLADTLGIYPDNTVEFLRYIIFKATGRTLLIKSDTLIDEIKQSSYDPTSAFIDFGLDRLGTIFNRFKPLFLAFKNKTPKAINKISKLSKTLHEPLVINALNEVTQRPLSKADIHWLDNATPFVLFKALSACYNRKNGQDAFLYLIRNGTSWVKEHTAAAAVNGYNFDFIMKYSNNRFDLSEKSFYLPEDISYALPTSEKMFVGSIPMGTKFYGDKLAVGIYWKDAWGASDLDLSGLNIAGKIGWNANYNQQDGNLMYSGDITSAPTGAVEYLYANKGLNVPTLINNNVYYGDANCGYKIIIGKGDAISRNYMMNPNNVFAAIKCESVQKQTILGMFLPEGTRQSFVLLNVGAGHTRVSVNSEISNLATRALYQQWNKPLTLKEVLIAFGAKIIDDPSQADFDLSQEHLTKDAFIKPFLN